MMRVFSLLLVLASFSVFAGSSSSDGVWVEGVGESKVAPDMASLIFSISTLDMSAKKSQQLNAQITEKVISKLKSEGVAGKDVQSSGFNVSPEYDYKNNGRQLKGHRVQHSFQAVIRKTSKLGEVLDALTSVGGEALSIGNIAFGLSNDASLQLKTLELALANAREKAETLAKASHQKLGEILGVEEVTGSGGIPVMRMEMMKSNTMAASTQMEPGEVGVSSRVRVHFKLKN